MQTLLAHYTKCLLLFGQVSDKKLFVQKLSGALLEPSFNNWYSQHNCHMGAQNLVGEAETFNQIVGG